MFRLLSSALAHVLVNTPDSLVVPAIPMVPHPVKTQLKAPAAMLGHNLIEYIRRLPRQGYNLEVEVSGL